MRLDDSVRLSLRGSIDRIDLDGERRVARLLDYKTGKNRLGEDPAEWTEDGAFIQHLVYGLALEELREALGMEPLEAIESGYCFIGPDEEPQVVTGDYGELVGAFRAQLAERLHAIRDRGGFYPDPGPGDAHCEWCDYGFVCQGTRAGDESVMPEEG